MDNTTARFEDMALRVGQTLQLIISRPTERKHYTRLIGYAEPDFLIVRVPQENGWNAPIDEGQAMQVRLFSGTSIFTFETRVQACLLQPRNYLLLSFPQTIHESRMRAHARITCDLPVQLVSAVNDAGPAQRYRIQDLSGGGASLVGPAPLGQVGDPLSLRLEFDLKATGTHESVLLQAQLRSVTPQNTDEGVVYQHGVQFIEVDPRVLLLVHELQQDRA